MIFLLLLSLFSTQQPLGEDMLFEHNLIRRARNLAPFELSQDLSARAQKHSEEMAKKGTLFHSKINPGEAENVAGGYGLTSTRALKEWWKSRLHRRNILGPYKQIGYGSAESRGRIYWTVIFR